VSGRSVGGSVRGLDVRSSIGWSLEDRVGGVLGRMGRVGRETVGA